MLGSTTILSLLGVTFATAETTFSTSEFSGKFASGSGVLQSLVPQSDTGFDFSPSDVFAQRDGVGNYHTGDLTFHWRVEGSEYLANCRQCCATYISAHHPRVAVCRQRRLNASSESAKSRITDHRNRGHLGFLSNSITSLRTETPDDTTNKCSFVDPYIGPGCGVCSAWRINRPSSKGFTPGEILSLAYAQNGWSDTDPWNEATSSSLMPGDTVTFGLRFSIASQDESDPFNRSPSIIAYDYGARAQILQEQRVWIAGLSDEGGSSYSAAAMKTSVHPLADEVLKLEQMANHFVWGTLQDADSTGNDVLYGVKRSVFYYEPDKVPGYAYDSNIDWTTWESWNQFDAWSVLASLRLRPCHHRVLGIVQCRARKPRHTHTARPENALEQVMASRQQFWAGESDPFGSEMAWDSTGQEGVYIWSKYFNDSATVDKTLRSIRGYMPTVAHWGWNGNARRYWDFVYGGKLEQVERMIHHYGSSLNAIPLLDNYMYESSPSDVAAFYDLRVGYGGNTGPLANINPDGFASTAFHSFPDVMAWDNYTGDYGPNFNGQINGGTSFLVEHPDFGWVSFGGNVQCENDTVTVQPRDLVRRRFYVAAVGLFLRLTPAKSIT
ncbi:hypothetical protein MRB53_041036 [Persea americana]|nr:hypothetical protein MRB53_041036 [Persea americana]